MNGQLDLIDLSSPKTKLTYGAYEEWADLFDGMKPIDIRLDSNGQPIIETWFRMPGAQRKPRHRC